MWGTVHFSFLDALTPSGEIIPERTRLEILNHQGRAALLSQDLEKYATCLQEGLDRAIRLQSQKRYNEAVGIYQTIPASWATHSRII